MEPCLSAVQARGQTPRCAAAILTFGMAIGDGSNYESNGGAARRAASGQRRSDAVRRRPTRVTRSGTFG